MIALELKKKTIFPLHTETCLLWPKKIFTSVVDVAFSYSYALKGSSF